MDTIFELLPSSKFKRPYPTKKFESYGFIDKDKNICAVYQKRVYILVELDGYYWIDIASGQEVDVPFGDEVGPYDRKEDAVESALVEGANVYLYKTLRDIITLVSMQS